MNRSAPLRRSPLPARTSPLRRTTRLAPVSARRAREQRVYTRLKAAFLAEHERCQFPGGCAQPATTVQHLRGRRGARLNDTSWWAASCLAHNLWAEDHTGEALAIGWLVRVEGVA